MENFTAYEQYILLSKQNIDSFLEKNNYKGAFGLLIVFLEKLEERDKKEVISYYSKNLEKIMLK